MKALIQSISLKKTKYYCAAVGIVALLGVLATVTFNFSIKEKTISVPKTPEKEGDADIRLDKIHYTATNDQGLKEWELIASTANYFKDTNRAQFEDVAITFYSEKKGTFSLKGDIGMLNTETKDIELSGNVVGTSSDGYRFQTEFLSYEAHKRQARTDKKVLLESPQFDLEGLGMVMDLEKEKVFLLKAVKAQMKK